MNGLFLTTISYTKNDGREQKVTEQYLLDSFSYAEAESMIAERFGCQNLKIVNLIKPRIAEVFVTNDTACERYYKVTVAFIVIDEKTALEKRTKTVILVQAKDFDDAVRRFKNGMSGTLADYEIYSVVETPILEYINPNTK
jgi:hypothetical protein